nr:hypothetical protein [Tanacetum cinerariifolium]
MATTIEQQVALDEKKRRLCLSHLGRFCVSSGTQESKEKQRDALPNVHKNIKNTKAYKEYYAYATREAAPKPKASARRKRGEKTDESDDDDDDQDEAKKDNDDDDDEEEISKIDEQEATESGESDDEETKSDGESEEEETREEAEERFDPIPRTPKDSEDTGNGEEDQGLRISEEERMQEEEEADELYRDVDINQGRGLQVSQDIDDSHVTLTLVHFDGQESSSTSSFVTSLLNLIIDPGMESNFTTASSSVAPLPSPTSTMTPSIMKTTTTASQPPIPPTPIPCETNQSPEAVPNIPGIVHQYMHQEMTKAVREAVQTQTDRLQDSLQRENNEFLITIDDNMKKIIKEQAEVLTRSSHSSRTSYAVAADLSEMELKKILIDKMEGNKSIQEDVRMMIIRKDPPLDQTGGLRDEEKPAVQGGAQSWISELEKKTDDRSSFNKLLDTPIDFSNFIMNRLGVDTLTPKLLAGLTYELIRGSCNSLTKLEYHLEEVYKATTDQLDWVNPEGQQYPHNLLQPLSLIPDNRGHRVIPFEHFINNDLEYLRGGASSRKYTTSMTKTKVADYGHIKWIEDLFYGFAVNWEYALNVYSKRRIIAVTDLKIVEWHNYKHLDWISLSNLTGEEHFAFNVSLRMFTRSIVIQRHVEDLQLGVESYQKRLNRTKPDTY